MAEKEKKAIIVIKKITINKGGHHGGSWKVAFADFMTAMMCFFLVMWLVTQPEEVRKQVAKYFSGPTMIEQQLNAYGAEITLEKLFLDLVNEPLKAFQAFTEPADLSPDLLSLGTQKAALLHIANELGDIAKNVEINRDEISFEIPEAYLFEKQSSEPAAQFVSIMEKVKMLTTGLENSDVQITSLVFNKSFPQELRPRTGDVANLRLDLISNQVSKSFEHSSNKLIPEAVATDRPWAPGTPGGFIKFRFKQKSELPSGVKPRELKGEIGSRDSDTTVYDEFVRRMAEPKNKKKKTKSQ